jgi:hypothetical protein
MKRIIGNIGALPLPNGRFAFGRVIESSNVEFYTYIGRTETDLPKNWEVRFTVCAHVSFFRHMKLVGKRPFADEDEKHPPARYIYDVIGKGYSLYIHGEIIPSDYDNCKGLDRASVWEYEHIIDRIMETGKYPSLILDRDLSVE